MKQSIKFWMLLSIVYVGNIYALRISNYSKFFNSEGDQSSSVTPNSGRLAVEQQVKKSMLESQQQRLNVMNNYMKTSIIKGVEQMPKLQPESASTIELKQGRAHDQSSGVQEQGIVSSKGGVFMNTALKFDPAQMKSRESVVALDQVSKNSQVNKGDIKDMEMDPKVISGESLRPASPQSVAEVGSVFEPIESVKSEKASQSGQDISSMTSEQKVLALKRSLQDAGISDFQSALGVKTEQYTALKKQYFPDGLPEGTTVRSLFENSTSGQNLSSAELVLPVRRNAGSVISADQGVQVIQQGNEQILQKDSAPKEAKSLEEDLSAYRFDSPSAMFKAQAQAVKAAQAIVRKEIISRVEALFQANFLNIKKKYIEEHKEFFSMSNFDELIDQGVQVKKEEMIEEALALPENVLAIEKAGLAAKENFNANVKAAEQKNKKDSVSQNKLSSDRERLKLSVQKNKVRDEAIKRFKEEIYNQVELDYSNNQKEAWLKEYKFKNPRATAEQIQEALVERIHELADKAYLTPENKTRLKEVESKAVEAFNAEVNKKSIASSSAAPQISRKFFNKR